MHSDQLYLSVIIGYSSLIDCIISIYEGIGEIYKEKMINKILLSYLKHD